MPNFQIDPSKLKSKRFKVKKLQYNTYEIDHPQVKGQLRLIAIPTHIIEVPKDVLPPMNPPTNLPEFMIGTQGIAAFSNSYTNKKINLMPPNALTTAKKIEITNFVVDQGFEPWNEFIVEGTPPILIKTRTILSKLEWYDEYTDEFGAPSLFANHNTTHSASLATMGESGMT